MEEWPYNGKSLWKSLRPGQKWAAIIGAPIIWLMLREYIEIISFIGFVPVEVFLLFFGFFIVPWVYANGLGLVIGVFIEFLFYRRKDGSKRRD
jgi:ABC-type antimicrobial peptide transport system permease subunit